MGGNTSKIRVLLMNKKYIKFRLKDAELSGDYTLYLSGRGGYLDRLFDDGGMCVYTAKAQSIIPELIKAGLID